MLGFLAALLRLLPDLAGCAVATFDGVEELISVFVGEIGENAGECGPVVAAQTSGAARDLVGSAACVSIRSTEKASRW